MRVAECSLPSFLPCHVELKVMNISSNYPTKTGEPGRGQPFLPAKPCRRAEGTGIPWKIRRATWKIFRPISWAKAGGLWQHTRIYCDPRLAEHFRYTTTNLSIRPLPYISQARPLNNTNFKIKMFWFHFGWLSINLFAAHHNKFQHMRWWDVMWCKMTQHGYS